MREKENRERGSKRWTGEKERRVERTESETRGDGYGRGRERGLKGERTERETDGEVERQGRVRKGEKQTERVRTGR